MNDFLEEFSWELNEVKAKNYKTIYQFISDTKQIKEKLEIDEIDGLSNKKLEFIIKKFTKIKEALDSNKISSMQVLRGELEKIVVRLNKKEETSLFPKLAYTELTSKNSIFIVEAPLLLSTFMSRLTAKRLQEVGIKNVAGYYYFEKVKFIVGDLKVVTKEKISEFVSILNNKIPKEIDIIPNISLTINDKYVCLLVYKINTVSFEEVVNNMKNFKIYVK